MKGEPFELDAHVAIQPWNEVEKIERIAVVEAHYLVVKETFPDGECRDT